MEELKSKIGLCIPGSWPSRTDFIQAIVEMDGDRYIAAGAIILDRESNVGFSFFLEERRPDMENLFKIGSHRFPLNKTELDEINSHSIQLYILSDNDGLEKVTLIAELASKILNAGGLGVQNLISGCAYSRNQWLTKSDPANGYELSLQDLFVFQFVSDEHDVYSVGATQFGVPDIWLEGEDTEERLDTAKYFLDYLMETNPDIDEGHTYSLSPEHPIWTISKDIHPYEEADSFFDLSLGVYKLRLKQPKSKRKGLLGKLFNR